MIMALVQSVSQILILIGLVLPMHKMSFFSAWLVRVARMSTHVLWVYIPSDCSDFCWLFRRFGIDRRIDWCHSHEHWDGIQGLLDSAHRLCAPALYHIWPAMCNGLSAAYGAGWIMIVSATLNMFLQLIASYLLYDYSWRKANPRYRMTALSCTSIGTLLMFFSLGFYYILVIIQLDNVYGGGLGMLVSGILSMSRGFGMAEGFVLISFGTSLQVVSMFMFCLTQSESREDEYEDYRMNKEFQESIGKDQNEYGSFPAPSQQPQVYAGSTTLPVPTMAMAPQQPMFVVSQGPPVIAQMPADTAFGMGMASSATHSAGPPSAAPMPPYELAKERTPAF